MSLTLRTRLTPVWFHFQYAFGSHVNRAATPVICTVFQPSVAHWKSASVRYVYASSTSSGEQESSNYSSNYNPQNCSYTLQRRDFNPTYIPIRFLSNTEKNCAMELSKVVSILNKFAPTYLAGSWDNVGLLLEPTSPHFVNTMCLTNDLTEEVLAEAIEKKTDFILSYHPPIFGPLKRLTMRNVTERIVVRAVENRIAVYSPHTCYDIVEGGVTDWLVQGLGDVKESRPLDVSNEPSGDYFRISFSCSDSAAPAAVQKLQDLGASAVMSIATQNSNVLVSCTCIKSSIGEVVSSLRKMGSVDKQSEQIIELSKAPMLKTGAGRLATISEPTPISTMVERIKAHLKLSHVQIATGQGKTLDSLISTVAICAGSGASVLKNIQADLYLTGEMSHHEILAAVAMGTTVIVCNHSNTERGFLHILQSKFTKMFDNQVNVFVSETDRDPLQVV